MAGHGLAAQLVLHGLPYGELIIDVLAVANDDAVAGVSDKGEALVDGRPVALTASEFDLLAALMQEPGRAFSRLQLLEKAFGDDFEGLERNVDVHVMNLRRKLGLRADGAIKAVYGVGYKFEAS